MNKTTRYRTSVTETVQTGHHQEITEAEKKINISCFRFLILANLYHRSVQLLRQYPNGVVDAAISKWLEITRRLL
jgi:hypothetical protein